jgi:phosphoesterase PA-phosphatase related
MEKKKNAKTIMIAAAVILLAAAGYITYEVAAVYETLPLPLDKAVQNFFFSLHGPVQDVIISSITHLSDTVTIIAFCIVLLILPNRKTYGLPVSLACLGGVAIYKPLKHFVLRARPDASLHLVTQGGYSFPSGHSVTSIVFYGLMLYLIQKHCKNEKLKTVLSWICGILAVVIGPSRIYVGVHWPTDVLAGWCLGGGILIIAILILEKIYVKKELQP